MKRKEQSVLLAGLLALALAGCSSTGTSTADLSGTNGAASQGGGSGATASTSDSGTSASASDTGSAASSTYGSSGSMAGSGSGTTAGTAGTSASMPGTAPGGGTATMATPNSTVTSIEVVQRPAGSGSTATGSSGTAGSTGSAAMGDRMYRITLRMDDGQTQVITQEWAPTFSTGDRVRMSSGVIQH